MMMTSLKSSLRFSDFPVKFSVILSFAYRNTVAETLSVVTKVPYRTFEGENL